MIGKLESKSKYKTPSGTEGYPESYNGWYKLQNVEGSFRFSQLQKVIEEIEDEMDDEMNDEMDEEKMDEKFNDHDEIEKIDLDNFESFRKHIIHGPVDKVIEHLWTITKPSWNGTNYQTNKEFHELLRKDGFICCAKFQQNGIC